jgi:hypothetical protein
LGVSERFACRVLGQHHSTQRKAPAVPDDEAALREETISLARLYGRYPILFTALTLLLLPEQARGLAWCLLHRCVGAEVMGVGVARSDEFGGNRP